MVYRCFAKSCGRSQTIKKANMQLIRKVMVKMSLKASMIFLYSLSKILSKLTPQILKYKFTNTFKIEISFCLSFDNLSGVFLKLILLIATGCVVCEIN